MVLTPIYEKKFLKHVRLAEKRRKDMKKLKQIINMLIAEKQLPPKNRNHKLIGTFKDCWECHIEPDWLLVYRKTLSTIIFIKTGTHSDIF